MYGTLISTEYATLTNSVINPEPDRRCKYDWTKYPTFSEGTKFKFELCDLADEYREMWGDGDHNSKRGGEIMKALDDGWKFHVVMITMKGERHYHQLRVRLTYKPGEETAEVEYGSELAKLIYEGVQTVEKTTAELIKDAMDQDSVPAILVDMVENGMVTIDQIREAHKIKEARLQAEWDARQEVN